MSDVFTTRVRTAASAGWTTLLLFWALMAAGGAVTLLLMHYEPAWMLKLIGGNMTWAELSRIYVYFFSVIKIVLLVMLMATVFLTFWGKRLAKASG